MSRQPAPHRPRRTRAFTLLELVVTVVVLAVLAAISVVAFGRIAGNARGSAASASAGEIAGAINARAARDDTTPAQVVGDLWDPVKPGQFFSALGVQFDGAATYRGPAGSTPGQLSIAPAGTTHASCVAIAGATGLPASVLSCDASAGPALSLHSGSPLPAATPYSVTFSPRGDLMVAPSTGGAASLFSVDGARITPIGAVTTASGSRTAAFNPTGSLLAIANREADSISLFTVDGTTVRPAGTVPASSPFGITFNRSGSQLVTVSQGDQNVSLYSVVGTTVTLVDTKPVALFGWTATFNPAGNLLVTTAQSGVNIFGVTQSALNPLRALLPGVATYGAAFNASGSQLAVATDQGVYTFAVSGTAVSPISGPVPAGPAPRAVAFSPSGSLLAVGHDTGSPQPVVLFSVDATGTPTPVPGSPFPTGGSRSQFVAFNSAGSLLAASNEYTSSVAVFDVW